MMHHQSTQFDRRNPIHGCLSHHQNPPWISPPLKRTSPSIYESCFNFQHMGMNPNPQIPYQGNNFAFNSSSIPPPPPLKRTRTMYESASTYQLFAMNPNPNPQLPCLGNNLGYNPSSIPPPPLNSEILNLLNSLEQQSSKVEEPIGLDFDHGKLKIRHESVINALYYNLPRKCTSCGSRFKTQEEHREHMDWHVKKNREAMKKKKIKGSRNWFEDTTDFRAGEMKPQVRKSFDEYEVVANVDEKYCALCCEKFDEYYNDEVDEWMYKQAVYLHDQSGSSHQSIEVIDKSQLGPIVHVKCRTDPDPDPNVVLPFRYRLGC